MHNYSIDGLQRISKAAARKAYDKGIGVTFCACKMSPKGPWNFGAYIKRNPWETDYNTFDDYINNYTYYNCSNETGRYVAFYIAE